MPIVPENAIYNLEADVRLIAAHLANRTFLEPMIGTLTETSMRYARQPDGTRIYIRRERPL